VTRKEIQAKLAALAEEHCSEETELRKIICRLDFLAGANAAIELCSVEAEAREGEL